MLNKTESKKVKKKKLVSKVEAKSQQEQTQEVEKNSFDFGGLPPRDLKKSLGCG
jgi:hypothetical protein